MCKDCQVEFRRQCNFCFKQILIGGYRKQQFRVSHLWANSLEKNTETCIMQQVD